jgi:signal transduction histidine kinase
LRLRLDWLNRLRWGAVAVVVGAVLIGGLWLQLPLPLGGLSITAGGLAILNLVYVARNRRQAPVDIRAEIRLVKVQIVGDLLILSELLNLTGGLENPFFILYIVHVILASLLFKGREIYQITALAVILFSVVVLGEYLGLLPHHHLYSAGEMAHGLPFVLAGLGAFWLVMLTCACLGASIMKHNRSIKDELVERQAGLERADAEKMSFFRFVTHEVKSPVSTAQSAVHAALELDGDNLAAPVRNLLERALGRLEQANLIVRNLADLTRGGQSREAGEEEIDLAAVTERIIGEFAESAAERGVSVVLEPVSAPEKLRAEPDMVDKVIGNLVSNAIRYSNEAGRVTVTLSGTPQEVSLAVADRGIGIPAADQTRIFDEFYRTQRAREVSQLGTGLGLSIVRRFVERMGGRVELSSEVGVGSTFTVIWPRGRARAGVVS